MSLGGSTRNVGVDCQGAGEEGRSLTRQSMKNETDINRIVGRFQETGMLNHVASKTPVYADVSGVSDYREALEQVRQIDEFFMKLPAKVRARFENSPAGFLDFMSDAGNLEEARELGLVPVEPVPPVPPVVPPVVP